MYASPTRAPGSCAILDWIRWASESRLGAIANNAATARAITLTFPPSRSNCRANLWTGASVDLGPDALVVLCTQHDRADDKRDQRYNDRKCEAGVDVPRPGNEAGSNDREKSSKPSIAEVIR